MRHVALALAAAFATTAPAHAREKVRKTARLEEKAGPGHIVALRSRADVDASVVELTGDRPLSFTTLRLPAPPRVVLDFVDATFLGVEGELSVEDGTVRRVGAAAAGTRTARVVIELAGDAEFDVRASGNRLDVRVPRLSPRRPLLVASAALSEPARAEPPIATPEEQPPIEAPRPPPETLALEPPAPPLASAPVARHRADDVERVAAKLESPAAPAERAPEKIEPPVAHAEPALAQSELTQKHSEQALAQSELTPLRSELTPLRSELTLLRSELTPSRSELTLLRSELTPLRSELAQKHSEQAPEHSELAQMRSDPAPARNEPAPVLREPEQHGQLPSALTGLTPSLRAGEPAKLAAQADDRAPELARTVAAPAVAAVEPQKAAEEPRLASKEEQKASLSAPLVAAPPAPVREETKPVALASAEHVPAQAAIPIAAPPPADAAAHAESDPAAAMAAAHAEQSPAPPAEQEREPVAAAGEQPRPVPREQVEELAPPEEKPKLPTVALVGRGQLPPSRADMPTPRPLPEDAPSRAAPHRRPKLLASVKPRRSAIHGIGFRPSAGGTVIIRSDHAVVYSVAAGDRAVLVDLPGATIPLRANRLPIDTSGFGGAVQRVLTKVIAGGVQLRVELRRRVDFDVQQHGNVLTVTFAPPG